MRNKLTLSIEQMNHLESLGLDTSDASMYWYKTVNVITSEEYYELQTNNGVLNNWQKKKEFNPHIIPTYTLQDILSKLPPFIKNYDNLPNDSTRESRATKWLKLGRLSEAAGGFDGDGYWQYFDAISPIDCAYQMLLWCIENNYIKTNKI